MPLPSMRVFKWESWVRLTIGARNGQMDMKKTITAIRTEIMTRFRFCGMRDKGVVKTMVATKPKKANFFKPIVIQETGGANITDGTRKATAKRKIKTSGIK